MRAENDGTPNEHAEHRWTLGPVTRSKGVVVGLACVALASCHRNPAPPASPARTSTSPQPLVAPAPPLKFDRVSRGDFNRLAAELALPLFWSEDKNHNRALDADELAVYWGIVPGAALTDYVAPGRGGFTAKMRAAYEAIIERQSGKVPTPTDPTEAARRAAVVKELAQGRPTLVSSDFTKASPEERRFVTLVMQAAELVEQIYAKQLGTAALAAQVPADDTASRMLFFRSQGPRCQAPLTQNDPLCSAVPGFGQQKISGLYPRELVAQPGFCEALGKQSKALMDPFVVVDGDPKAPRAVPYNEAYKAEMTRIAELLRASAGALGEREPALKNYLAAAAQSFSDNHWWPADEAWAKMDAKNSKFYLRIGPDETYEEPCNAKALFHVSFGLINQGSLKWQQKLEPLRNEMESALAALAGPPYTARKVSFKLPDFVDIALNAGNSRAEFGATIGQSLPNFGPVANEGRGRTVAMTGFYTDADSVESAKRTAGSLFCTRTMAKYSSDPEPLLVSTVLHEAAHNLGPAHQYKARGKTDREAFGGPLASTLEELKAQTAALYFVDWLVPRHELDPEQAEKTHVQDLYWAFGHISRGMYTGEHQPKAYSQLAAIQLGWLMRDGAVAWKADEAAANAQDRGCFELAFDKIGPAVKSLMTEVAQIKSRGDRTRAEKLVKEFVDVTGEQAKVHAVITERVLREPKASFVYSIQLE